ncbi:succinate-semialdehyde dehydrogenase, partial [Pseudomonas sp. SIMBA_059]
MSAISSLTHAISLDPYSGEQIGAYPFDTDAALEAALQRAKVGYGQWRQVSL